MQLLLLCAPARALGEADVAASGLAGYCSEPPFASAGIKPNLLLMIDNSASMYDPAYTTPSTYCLDDSYQDGKSYSGYFDAGSSYQYDAAAGKFVAGAVLPAPPCSSGSCAASTGFLYLEMAAAVAPATYRTVKSFKASGNFLNWLTMSKLDVEKQVLTGGKFVPDSGSTTHGVLQGASRGCQGKRFVKMVAGLDITFAVRGPMLNDTGFNFQTSRGGAATIEIYDKAYRKQACLNAVDAWLAGDKTRLLNEANSCMDVTPEPAPLGGTMPSSGEIYHRVMGACYDYLVKNVPVPADHVLRDDCMGRYHGILGYSGSVTKINVLDDICGRIVKHSPNGSAVTTGYLGKCLVGLTSTMSDACIQGQVTDYCNEIRTPYVTDPSSMANMTGTNANVPSFILDAGITHLGKISGSFAVRVSVDSPPAGLIQQFTGRINFGAMAFNANGAAGSECGPGKLLCVNHCTLDTSVECQANSDCAARQIGSCVAASDGGRIISYINDPASPPGDHASGLIAAIDGIKAVAWTPVAESFYEAIGYFANRTDLRLQSVDFDAAKPAPSTVSCQRNHILIVSDGMSTADSNPEVEALATLYGTGREVSTGKDGAANVPVYEGSRSLDDLAWIASRRNIKQFSKTLVSTEAPVSGDQSITTHVIFNGISNGAPGEADPATLMRRTAESGGGIYAGTSDPGALYGQFQTVLRQVAEGTNSGTDASLLATGNGNGAIFLEERYYPKKTFDGDTTASWTGEMQSLWYYIDPFLGNTGGAGSTVREDTEADLRLNLANDRVVSFQDLSASLYYDADADGSADGAAQLVNPEAVTALWRGGKQLWSRDLGSAPRTIYTPSLPGGTPVTGTGLMTFSWYAPDHSSVLKPYLQAADKAGAVKLMKYLHGFDFPGDPTMRSRTVQMGNIPGATVSTLPADPYVSNPRDKGIGVWKLGDIISSTPKLQSSTALSGYNLPAPKGYNDASYASYVGSRQYQDRGMVYVGANDGMLHAFNLGRLKPGDSAQVKAILDTAGGTPGKEQWAFIPKNALPYLTYLKEPAYQHLYYVDGSLTLADVSIGDNPGGGCSGESYWNCPKPRTATVVQSEDNSLDPARNTWRSVVIGGMGLGGASWGSCGPLGGGADCVPTPIPDPLDATKRLGYSSYFALDVTDPEHPSLLWEFSHPELGYSTTGPAIVRLGDPDLNGRWFALFGSGPTGPIADGQFLGHSNRELKFFVVDLRSGALIKTIATGIPNAFAGPMSGGAIDADRWDTNLTNREKYRDDAVYMGYVAQDPVLKTWTRGGVGRIMIAEIPDGTQLTDDNVKDIWHWSRVVGYDPVSAPGDATGPVTTGIAKLQDRRNKNLWLYFGSGRYYYRLSEQDDWSGARSIYGIKEPCYLQQGTGSNMARSNFLDRGCSAPVCPGGTPSADCITDQTGSISAVAKGWRIDLDAAQGTNGAERVIADPASMTGGAVFFTTFRPSSVPCQFGSSYLWGVRYDTGDAIADGQLQGKVLVQLSTGRLQETRLGAGLPDKGKRRGAAMAGKPGGVKVVTNSGLKPLKKIIHMQER